MVWCSRCVLRCVFSFCILWLIVVLGRFRVVVVVMKLFCLIILMKISVLLRLWVMMEVYCWGRGCLVDCVGDGMIIFFNLD